MDQKADVQVAGSGERYDGEWKEGKEEGLGVFTWSDGSTYDGFWQRGKKHGIGVFRSAPPPVITRRATAAAEIPEAVVAAAVAGASAPAPPSPERRSPRNGRAGGLLIEDIGETGSAEGPLPAPSISGPTGIPDMDDGSEVPGGTGRTEGHFESVKVCVATL